MELQALLVLCGLGVAGAAVVLLMSLFSASGTSYEEAIAQQRKATTELLALADNKNKNKKSGKKANKKLAKKERKENVAVTTGSEPESEAQADSGAEEVSSVKPHVEFRAPIYVDVQSEAPPSAKIRKRGKDSKMKPILMNKEDPSCVTDTSSPPSPTGSVVNHFEEIHPKDEFELLQESRGVTPDKTSEKKEEYVEKKESKPVKQAKGKNTPKQPVTEAVVVVKEEVVQQPKEQRKGKKLSKTSVSEDAVDSRDELFPVNPTELTTEKLLKAAPAPQLSQPPPPPQQQKTKKKKQELSVLALMAGDGGSVNVGELVRLVSEAPLSRTEIQLLTDALLNKHHGPLPVHSDWTEGPNDPVQKLKKQLAEKEKALTDEMEASQALHAKLKELRASLNAERSRATAASRAADESNAELVALQQRNQRLIDDNHALNQEKHMLQTKLSVEGEAQAQRAQMEIHIQRLSEAEAGLLGQVSALQAEANARALEAGQVRCEAANARDAALAAQQHAAELALQLQEANRVYAELDIQRQNAIHTEQAAQHEIRQLQERLSGLQELQVEVQKLTSKAQVAEGNAEKAKDELEKQKQQLSNELSSLKEQLAARDSEIAELKLIKVASAQNGLPNSNDLKSSELSKVESVIESLRSELADARHSSQEQKEQIDTLRQQLAQYQDKNNELRTKNWKIMEALQSAEKSLQTKSTASSANISLSEALSKAQQAQYSETVSILKSACPSIAPSSNPSRAWIDTFAAALKAELATRRNHPEAPNDGGDLRAQNVQLQGLVDKYKKIIDDTEGVLSRLQQNVTAEEARWAQQLSEKQRELDELQQKTVTQMQKKIDSLEGELRRALETHHSNSFADSERLTQERLMSDLSDKHKLDSCNGPLQQIGVVEK